MDLEMLQAQIWLREADAGRIDIEGILKDDEAWVYLAQDLVGQAKLFHDKGWIVLDKDIGIL